MSSVDIDDRGDFVVATLTRPQQRNAINAEMIAELHALCATLEASPKLLIITGGSNGFFAAGADIGQLRDRGREEALLGMNINLFARIRSLSMPTIAAIDGYALGGGAELTYACDIRLATPRALFGQPEPALGIIAGAGASYRLVRLLGESVAKQILLAGHNIDAQRALQLGLVLDVVPPEDLLERAETLARTMLRNSSIALRMTKLAVDAGESAHPQIDLVMAAMLFGDEEKHERMTAFLNKNQPS